MWELLDVVKEVSAEFLFTFFRWDTDISYWVIF
jgi:hypothetical protein